MIRIPSAKGKSTRMELRNPDPAANPYLTLALCLAAGLDGIENKIEPPKESTFNLFDAAPEMMKEHGIHALPNNLMEAIKGFEADEFVQSVLGKHISRTYIKAKKNEWDSYCQQISKWEISEYLGKY